MNKKNQPHFTFSTIQFLFALAVMASLIGMSGCASLSSVSGSNLPATAPSAGNYRVEMSGGFGKPAIYNGVLDGPLTVQTALERSGAIKKFRYMDVKILRVVEETGRPLIMSVEYDAGENRITHQQNYALMPNDRIVVEASSNNMIDKIIGSVSGK